MSEKLYVLLLRLYHSRFRQAYGDEAILLVRDRVRDERGFVPKARLWWDLLVDLMVSLPREYRHVGAAAQRVSGGPCFDALPGDLPRPEALCAGAALSVLALAAVSVAISWTATNGNMRGSAAGDLAAFVIQGAEHGTAYGGDTTVGAAERKRVIDGAVANLTRFYFAHDIARKTAAALLAHENNGDDSAATQGAAFAELLTAQMREASHDMHLVLEYSPSSLPSGPPVQTSAEMARFRQAMLQQHCMIRKADILPHDIGYLKLDFFGDASVCGDEVKTAMASLNNAQAVIFDLRDNTGGFPETVSLVAGYLFDHPEYMFSPQGAPTLDSWTRSPVRGSLLMDEPVYVLTSSATWSGAEQFSYDLKMLKRATLVGETTRGGAHAGVFHRIDDHFGIGIPEERSVNPYGTADWEGVGVPPDVNVKAADAFDTALGLAQARLRHK